MSSPLLILLLCTALGLADTALAMHTASSTSPTFVLLAGMAFGQVTLLSVWCVTGRGPWVVRLLTTLAIVNGLAGLVAPATAAAWSDWFVALAGYGTISSLALWLISASTRTSRHQPRHHRRQYSLASLMSVVTLASVLLGMTRWVSISWPQLASFAAVGWWMAILALVTLQGVTAERPGWIAMPIAVALLAGVLLCRMTGLYDTCYFTLLCLAQIATITVGMLAVQPSLVPAGATKQAA